MTADVEGIASTGRHYDRVIFVTSQSARQADRLALEQSLSEKYALPVTVPSRWSMTDPVN